MTFVLPDLWKQNKISTQIIFGDLRNYHVKETFSIYFEAFNVW